MGTWVVTSGLEDKDKAELIDLKNRALAYLVDNQLDGVGCAQALGISFLDYLDLRILFIEDFDGSKKALISDCEALLAGVAQGTIQATPQRINAAKYILDRQSEEWLPKKITKKEESALPKATGQGKAILEKFLEEQKKNEADAAFS